MPPRRPLTEVSVAPRGSQPLKLFVLAAVVLFAHLPAVAQKAVTLFNPDTGYRIARYRSPVNESVPGGTRIWIDDIEQIVAEKSAILVDVMPSTGPGPDPKTGAWRIVKKRQNIPGSVWLPDVGKGKLDSRMETYFRNNLTRLTGGDTSRKIVIYCQADCWMSWNAIKRAASFGYTNLLWYPDGSDGWRDWDGPFVSATPVPLQPAK